MSTSNSGKSPKDEKNLQAKKKYSINFSLDHEQFEQLKREYRQAGRPSMSSYIREGMGLERKSAKVNPFDIIRVLDKIGAEVGDISDHMDRVVRYADRLAQRGEADCQPVQQFNLLMDKYLASRRELVKAYRAVVRTV